MIALAFQQQTSGPPDALFAAFGILWCAMMALIPAQFIVFIVALIQILQRNMPATEKLLWALVSWFLPIIGPILWWTIGSRQNPHHPPGGPPLPRG